MNKTDKIIEILKNNISVARFGDNTIEIIGIKNAAQEINQIYDDWPKDGDTYWFICPDGSTNHSFFENDDEDKRRIGFGNYFKNNREAVEARDKVKQLLNELR